MWKNISPDRGCIIDSVLFSNLGLSLYLLKTLRNNTIWNVFGTKKIFFHGLKFTQDKIIPALKLFSNPWETSLIPNFLLLNPIVSPQNSSHLVYTLKFSYAITSSSKRKIDSTCYCHILSIPIDSPPSSANVLGLR